MGNLIVRTNPDNHNLFDGLITNNNQITEKINHQSIDDLKKYNLPIVFLAPNDFILLTTVKLPITSLSKLREAVPYALEDQLAEDIDNLHFAIDGGEGEHKNIAVVNKSKLNQWISLFKKNNLLLISIIPELILLNNNLIENNIHYIKIDNWSGVKISKNNLDKLFLDSKLNFNKNNYFENINLDLIASSKINLLQGEYQPKEKKVLSKKLWKLSGLFFSLFILLNLGTVTAKYVSLKNQYNQTQNQIKKLYTQAFPGATDVESPRIVIQRQLQKMKALASGGKFLNLLGIAGSALQNQTTIELQGLNFENNQLLLTIQANSFSELAQLSQKIAQSGIQVSQQNATTKGNVVTAQLILKGN